ncbi:MAG: GNAT family N-acetyltransferase [Myxococcota bacterium]
MDSTPLTFTRLSEAGLDAFLRLATDEHIRRYLLDGAVADADWARAEVQRSDRLFEREGVGLWLVSVDEQPVGFAGFRVFEDLEPEPQLLYALLERVTGRGYATLAARWLVNEARQQGWSRVGAGVDEVNAASVRVLEKAGFVYLRSVEGSLGPTRLYALTLGE